jgi:hypothetical protein
MDNAVVPVVESLMKYFSQALLNFLADAGLISAVIGIIGALFTYMFKNAYEEVYAKNKINPIIPWNVNLLFNLGFTFLLINTVSIMVDAKTLETITSFKKDLATSLCYIAEIWIFSFIISTLCYVTVIKTFNIGKDIWINSMEERKVNSEIKVVSTKIELMKQRDLLRELLKEQLLKSPNPPQV